MASSAVIDQKQTAPVTTYHEKMIGKTLYRVTSVYKGAIDLKRALEDLTVSKAIQSAETPQIRGNDRHG